MNKIENLNKLTDKFCEIKMIYYKILKDVKFEIYKAEFVEIDQKLQKLEVNLKRFQDLKKIKVLKR